MTTYECGAHVWVMHASRWNQAVIKQIENQRHIRCMLMEQADHDVEFDTMDCGRNGDIRIHPCNPLDQIENGVEDLSTLVHLHEPAILNALSVRYARNIIYTKTGSILVAINPFQDLPIFNDVTKNLYAQAGANSKSSQLPPHVFSVADTAYRNMMQNESNNQSILVSGESGAGKTETTKLIMSYLALVSTKSPNESTVGDNKDDVRSCILNSNPILEAFGNAMTTRNSNSSRFGKFIRLGFDNAGQLVGASTSTYLLERVRLVSQGNGERNFHIFYELIQGASIDEATVLGLKSTSFAYLADGCVPRRDGVDDARQFQITRKSMENLGLSMREIVSVLQVTAAFLHLGNFLFVDTPGGSMVDEDSMHSIKLCSNLLGISVEDIETNMTTKRIKAGSDIVLVGLDSQQSSQTRDVVAKTLYNTVFEWLVKRINDATMTSNTKKFIGVVDIFGFESFAMNSLEQLCINFANEKLQQLFSRNVFELEQEEYITEGIPWELVSYPNNDICVDLFEGKPYGIFSLLDEQCVVPRGNDKQLASVYFSKLNATSSAFSCNRVQQGRGQFSVHHYAGRVVYTTERFCEKNKDNVHPEALQFISLSSHSILQCGHRERSASQTSSTQKFRAQLKSLIGELSTTNLHFIRCIKPNDRSTPGIIDEGRFLDQLRCSGLLEVTKLTRLRYPVRISHDQFIGLFRGLFSNFSSKPLPSTSHEIHRMLVSWGIANPIVGRTKVFFDYPLLSHLHQARELRMRIAKRTLGRVIRLCLNRRERLKVVKQNAARRVLRKNMVVAIEYRKQLQSKKFESAQIIIARAWDQYIIRQHRRITISCITLQQWIRRTLLRFAMNRYVVMQIEKSVEKVLSSVRSSDYLGEFTSMKLNSKSTKLSPKKSVPDQLPWDARDTSSTSSSSIDDENAYDIQWECGMLGIHFGTDSCFIVVQRIHATLSTCIDIFDVSVGDRLIAVNQNSVQLSPSFSYNSIMRQIATAPKPVTLTLRRARCSPHLRVVSLQSDEYEILWNRKSHSTLGIEFDWDEINQVPVVTRMEKHGSCTAIPGRTSVCPGDWLSHVHDAPLRNKHDTWQKQLLNGPNTMLLRFQRAGRNARKHADLLANGGRLSEVESNCGMSEVERWSWDPKMDSTLHHLLFTDEDSSLGLVLRQPVYRFYLEVSDVKQEGAVHRQRHHPRRRILPGDQLVCVNHQNIRVIGHASALAQLKHGPKPVLLTFRRSQHPCMHNPTSQSC